MHTAYLLSANGTCRWMLRNVPRSAPACPRNPLPGRRWHRARFQAAAHNCPGIVVGYLLPAKVLDESLEIRTSNVDTNHRRFEMRQLVVTNRNRVVSDAGYYRGPLWRRILSGHALSEDPVVPLHDFDRSSAPDFLANLCLMFQVH